MVKVGVNGAAGRIGKFTTLELLQIPEIEVVALNDPVGAKALVDNYNLQDSTHGELGLHAEYIPNDRIMLNGKPVKIYKEKDASKIPWHETGVKIVEECSGFYTKDGAAKIHLNNGAERVIVSAPATGEELVTIIMGVNQEDFNPKIHNYISNASCTTKALATPLKLLMDKGIKIEALLMDTVHASTNSQHVLDFGDEAATLDNIVLTSTGAAKATSLVMPSLKSMDGFAARVPTNDGSFANLYFVANFNGRLDTEIINQMIKGSYLENRYFGRIGIFEGENVSSKRNIIGRKENAIVITSRTRVLPLSPSIDGGDHYLINLVSGYDNERGPPKDQALLTRYIADKCKC